MDVPYEKELGSTIEGEKHSLLLDLGAYDIDILESEDKTYFPVSVISSIFLTTYNAAVYIDGSIYIAHTISSISDEGSYIDAIIPYEKTSRTKQEAEQGYKELCFVMDNLYGKPQKAAVSELVAEKGFDKALDEYSEMTRKAKELLRSENLANMMIGLSYIEDAFYDGSHNSLFATAYNQIVTEKPDSALAISLKSHPDIQTAMSALNLYTEITDKLIHLLPVRGAGFSDYEMVKMWEDSGATLYRKDDTVVFVFNVYMNEVVPAFKWSLDYSAENGVKRFVIDNSTNMGGNEAVLHYIIAILKNKNRDNNTAYSLVRNKLTGNVLKYEYLLDLDLNGEINDLDKQVYYDFEYAIITSEVSYSCSNLLPCIAKSEGIPIIGERSGGGGCMVCPLFNSENMLYKLSTYYCMLDKNGNDVDLGAEVDYDLTKKTSDENGEEIIDYSGLYDIDSYKGMIDEYYYFGSDI